jgi:hypothetical protein
MNLTSDSFITWASRSIKNKNTLRLVLLAYRLAKSSQVIKGADINEPAQAARFFANEYVEGDQQRLSMNIVALLLSYVVDVNLLTMDDVYFIFGKVVHEKVRSLDLIETIVSSNAKITDAKQCRYVNQFTEDHILIKASVIIVRLRALQLSKNKGLPIKIHSRYLPIFDTYIQIGNKVATELRKWLLQKIKQAQTSGTDYNLTAGDLFSYFSIVSDRRLKTKSLELLLR